MANHWPHEVEQRDEAAVATDDDDVPEVAAARLILLDAGRVLMLCGALASVGISQYPAAAANNDAARHGAALVGLLVWLLGVSVSLLAVAPAPRRLPRAAQVGAAVQAYFFPPRY